MARKAVVEARPALTRERIVAVASDLIERDGLGAFTMRSLGRELGVSAMAVYSHFDSRDAILVAVLQRLMASMDTDPVPGEAWDDTLRRTMTSIYRLEMAHPELATIEVVPQTGENGLAEHTDKIVNLHLAQGMPEPVLTQAWALVDAYLTGFIGNAIAVRASRPPSTAELQVRKWLKGAAVRAAQVAIRSLGSASSRRPTPTRPSPMVSRSSSRAFERWRLPIPASGARLSRDAADRLSDGCPSATAPLRRRESCGSLAAPRIFRNSQNWGLTGGARFRNILTCARRFRAV